MWTEDCFEEPNYTDIHKLKAYAERLGDVAECSLDMIDQIGGWRSVATIGVGYGKGYSMEAIRAVMTKL